MKKIPLLILIIAISLIGCKDKKKDQKINKTEFESAPDFSADSAFTFISDQIGFGPRIPNTNVRACGYWPKSTPLVSVLL